MKLLKVLPFGVKDQTTRPQSIHLRPQLPDLDSVRTMTPGALYSAAC